MSLTIVTALFDIGRGRLGDGFKRPFNHYLETFGKLLKTPYPMVIFCDAGVEEFVWKHRDRKNTTVVRKNKDDLRNFPFYSKVQSIRKDPTWTGQAGWLGESTQAKLELYNPLVMSKQFFLNDAALLNYHGTKYFLWVDAGLANTVNVEHYFGPELEERITPHMDKMLYLAFPYYGQVEVHGFRKDKMNEYAGTDTEFVCRGGVFGGTKHAINDVNDIYYNLLNDTLNSGYMGTEESIFTLIAYRNKNKCNVHMIESNGLVYKFFEDIYATTFKPRGKHLAVYALTYNLPQQFKMWVESFKEAYPVEFESCQKYVVNNSTDPDVVEEYTKIFEENDFTVFNFDNIGINDGRHFIAEHFYSSDHEYMIFFEDDMLLQTDKNFLCKNGFKGYQDDLFSKSIEIIKDEKLDYLKFNYTEFYGDNTENWAWYNVPAVKREEYFPDGDKSTKVTKVSSKRGLPYAVGEYHYCNWPILFTKAGTHKIFLETPYEHKYEQTWMSLNMTLMREGQIRAGCLLASPINHNRVFHYTPGTRKENRHY